MIYVYGYNYDKGWIWFEMLYLIYCIKLVSISVLFYSMQAVDATRMAIKLMEGRDFNELPANKRIRRTTSRFYRIKQRIKWSFTTIIGAIKYSLFGVGKRKEIQFASIQRCIKWTILLQIAEQLLWPFPIARKNKERGGSIWKFLENMLNTCYFCTSYGGIEGLTTNMLLRQRDLNLKKKP